MEKWVMQVEIWKYHDQQMKKSKKIYQTISKQTQNKLQELLDTYNFTTEYIYNIAGNKTKERINPYIKQWKEQGLLKENSYFTVLANIVYRRTKRIR